MIPALSHWAKVPIVKGSTINMILIGHILKIDYQRHHVAGHIKVTFVASLLSFSLLVGGALLLLLGSISRFRKCIQLSYKGQGDHSH